MSLKYKMHNVPLKVLAVSVLAASFSSAKGATVSISSIPLAGVQQQYAPNIYLALSVEFPTAGAAYSNHKYYIGNGEMILNISGNGADLTEGYLGYFDQDKCYQFVGDGDSGYFAPSSLASTDYTCAGKNEFSGSVMNWLTMSAVDIFRHAMTGGNRAKGVGSASDNYMDADRVNQTLLRRANVVNEQNGIDTTLLRKRGIYISSMEAVAKYLPESYINALAADVVNGVAVAETIGMPRIGGFRQIYDDGAVAAEYVESHYRFADQHIYFYNIGFRTFPARKVINTTDGTTFFAYQYSGDLVATKEYATSGVLRKYYETVVKGQEAGGIPGFGLPVVVEACSSRFTLPEHCVMYGSGNYKPEGLLQQYGRRGARVATFGYLNANDHQEQVDGGVLRSAMKYLISPEGSGIRVDAAEWNAATGVLVQNPDRAMDVVNSGAINYLNKFGDASGYKKYDHSSELYYTALRYMRNADGKLGSVYKPNSITAEMQDGFPAIYDWGDPVKDGFPSGSLEPQCRTNTIIFIGDTNTHYDYNLPNFQYTGDRPLSNPQPDDPDVETQEYLVRLLGLEGRSDYTISRGGIGRHSPAGMAGLAYWARTNDIRPDLPGNQYGNNFIIDVLENGDSKETDGQNGNTYYMAAKYGGFDNSTNMEILSDEQWKDDAASDRYSDLFPKGMPKNFALANDPAAMVDALQRAMASGDAYTQPSQGAITTVDVDSGEVDLSGDKSTHVVSTSYDIGNLTGNIIKNRLQYSMVNGLQMSTVWDAAAQMNTAYHNATGWVNRNVYARGANGKITRFSTSNLASFEGRLGYSDRGNDEALVKYILGSTEDEDDRYKFRERNALIGTVISSVVGVIQPNFSRNDALRWRLSRQGVCQYTGGTTRKEVFYSVSSNDGMLHIFDHEGNEVFAYLLSSAMPEMARYATPRSAHFYLNDGIHTIDALCFGNETKDVLVGVAGRGGASVYAVDLSNLSEKPDQNNEKTILWEFTADDDADLGITVGKASLASLADGRPVAIVGSGYNNSEDNGHIFILDLSKPFDAPWVLNNNYWKVSLGRSGVGEVFVYDENGDGIPEKLYVGDYDGHLWRVNTEGADVERWTASKLYQAEGTGLPITMAPAAERVNGRLYVIAGTGQYLNKDALASGLQNYAYGFFDDGQTIVGHSTLLKQTVEQDVTEQTSWDSTKQTLTTISKNELTQRHQGWRLELLKGQTVSAAATISGTGTSRRIANFVTVRGTETQTCTPTGATAFLAVDLMDGGEYDGPVFDTNNDGQVNSSDTVGGMTEFLGIISPQAASIKVNINDQPVILNIMTGDTGTVSVLTINPNSNQPALRRLSWREIF